MPAKSIKLASHESRRKAEIISSPIDGGFSLENNVTVLTVASVPVRRSTEFFRSHWRVFLAISLMGLIGLVSVVLTSCSTTETRSIFSPPAIDGATFVGNKTCAECHTNYTRSFHSSPHARINISSSSAKVPGGIGCESCHGPGSLHVNAGGGRRLIVNPRKDSSACFGCHTEQHAEFNLPQRHPVIEGKMTCVQCHDPHGADIFKRAGGMAFARENETCAQCHHEQTRLVVFQHDAMRDGCTTCHSPHGSINDKMLVQRDNNLCLKCHAQVPVAGGDIYIGDVPHTTFLARGSCWSSGCHTAVHGSNVDRMLRY